LDQRRLRRERAGLQRACLARLRVERPVQRGHEVAPGDGVSLARVERHEPPGDLEGEPTLVELRDALIAVEPLDPRARARPREQGATEDPPAAPIIYHTTNN